MDGSNILSQLEHLDDEIDNLEETLEPLLASVTDVSSKLPLLDKAKLYVLITYAIESMLFSALRLNGVNAKEHPVFKELTRVRQYFDKIAKAEAPPSKPEVTLNKEAAIRFIRSDLADNKEVNTKLTEMIAKERAKAVAKTAAKAAEADEKRKSEDMADEGECSSEEPAPKKKSRNHKRGHKDKKKAKQAQKQKD